MSKKVFINLPVTDLQQSMNFYNAMGFVNNPQFSDESASCMVWSEEIFVMLLMHERFISFTNRPVLDNANGVGTILSLSFDSVADMNNAMEKSLATGATEPTEAKDYGFMQQRSILDPNGHYWELFYMDMSQFPES